MNNLMMIIQKNAKAIFKCIKYALIFCLLLNTINAYSQKRIPGYKKKAVRDFEEKRIEMLQNSEIIFKGLRVGCSFPMLSKDSVVYGFWAVKVQEVLSETNYIKKGDTVVVFNLAGAEYVGKEGIFPPSPFFSEVDSRLSGDVNIFFCDQADCNYYPYCKSQYFEKYLKRHSKENVIVGNHVNFENRGYKWGGMYGLYFDTEQDVYNYINKYRKINIPGDKKPN